MRTKLILPALILLATGCSAYKAASQPGPADLSGIGVGTPRQIVISKLGAPKLTDTTRQGSKQDYFEFQSGMHQASKARVLLYIAADLFTIGLAELVLWPMELTVLESATCTGIATYDADYKIDAWSLSNKGDSGQDC